MEQRQLGKTDIRISRIGLGSWQFGKKWWGDISDTESSKIIISAIESGINFVDTAPIYGFGHSEKVIGEAIKNIRQQVILASKCGLKHNPNGFYHDLSKRSIQGEIEQSLRSLRTDYIDLYQIHWPDPNVPLEDVLETMLSLKQKGLIRAIGLCNYPVTEINIPEVLNVLDSFQYQFSLIKRDRESDILPLALDEEVSFIAYGALHGGLLTGKYSHPPTVSKKQAKEFFYQLSDKAQWEMANKALKEQGFSASKNIPQKVVNWTTAQSGITASLVGCRREKQLRAIVD